jgi:hypothetical protein
MKQKWKKGDPVVVDKNMNNEILLELENEFPNIPRQILDLSLGLALQSSLEKKKKGKTKLSEEDLLILAECDREWELKKADNTKLEPIVVKGGLEIVRKDEYEEKILKNMILAEGIPKDYKPKLDHKTKEDEEWEDMNIPPKSIELKEGETNYNLNEYKVENAEINKS